jgi:small subunit ribosomal protein S4
LGEKQKVKYTYGVLERQFYKIFEEAVRIKGVTGENLIKFLEARLDNTVYRLGLSTSRAGARQLVGHRHITVNGKVVNISSYKLKPGDVVGVREKSKSLETINISLTTSNVKRFNWLTWDSATLSGVFVSLPERDQIPENIKEQLIVELYSK